MAEGLNIGKMAVIGCGSMGGGMAQLFAEHGYHVSIKDPSEDSMNNLLEAAKQSGVGDMLHKFTDDRSLCESLDKPKVIVFSLPHGYAGDSVLDGLMPYLGKDDIILDAANENYENTQRRQAKTVTRGIRYIGMGVSGGYQAARRGPSMCPGGDEQTISMILPILKKFAAKDPQGRACVERCGLGGSGHYVKMLHNGIEHGMMSAIAEAFNTMNQGLGMSYAEIADVFEAWNAEGELRNTFLIKISSDICRIQFPSSHPKASKAADLSEKEGHSSGNFVLATVLDKVVQDLTGEEGTGVWSNMEAVRLHVAAPTMTVAHYLRLASAYRGQREHVNALFGGGFPPQQLNFPTEQRKGFLEHLRKAVYVSCLAAYVQGLAVIDAANEENKWCIDYLAVWQIWRAGCIIQADYISDEILKPVFDAWAARKGKRHPEGQGESINLLLERRVVDDLNKGYPSLKNVVAKAVEADHVVPAMSATSEWIRYVSGVALPTSFYEAQLDYFGAHMYDEKGVEAPLPVTGREHFEWKAA